MVGGVMHRVSDRFWGRLALVSALLVSAEPALASGSCIGSGVPISVYPAIGVTETLCHYPGAVQLFASAGEGDGLSLTNSTNLSPTGTFSEPHAALHVHAQAFHIFEHWVFRTGLVWNGFEWVVGPVEVKESLWSLELANVQNADYKSQDIVINNTGNITTTDTNLSPIIAQGTMNAVTVINSGDLTSSGDGKVGIYARSGVGEFQFASVGVRDEFAFPGGPVSVQNSGNIRMEGWANSGIYALSVGGGVTIGNTGDIDIAGDSGTALRALAIENRITINNTGDLRIVGAGADGISADMRLPGRVTITNDGAINITGDQGTGIRTTNADAGEDASGAETRITGIGAITITGEDATGIDAMSRVGGTLLVDYAGQISVSGTHALGIVASTEEGASVAVKAIANVSASGPSAIGILLGGIGEAPGPNPDGSFTPANNGRLSVEVGAGVTIQGGSTGTGDYALERLGAGVAFLGGAENSLVNRGTITSASGLAVVAFEGFQRFEDDEGGSVVASLRAGPLSVLNTGLILGDIVTGSGNDTVVNQGLGVITGNIDLGGGANSLLNRDDAVINSLDRIALGSGNTFTNSGVLNPGGLGTIQSTTIIGNFVQTAGGRLLVDIRETGRTSDFLSITGTASLGGTVVPNFLAAPVELASEYRIISAAGGATSTGIAADPSRQVGDTVGYDFGLAFRGGTDVYLTAEKRAELAALASNAAGASGASGSQGENLGAVGGAMTTIEKTGGSGMGALITALRLSPNLETMAETMNRLIPQNQGAQTSNTSSSGTSFGNAMLSCTEREGPNAYTREGQCYWAKVTARRLDRDATSRGPGVDETATEISGGVQVKLWDQLRLGLALGWEDLQSSTFDQTQRLGKGEGGRFQAGVVVKNQWGPINAYLNVAGSWANYDLDRYVGLPGIGNLAEADQDVTSLVTRLRLSYLMDAGPWYVKPLVDIAATHIRLGGYTETGAGVANLAVAGTRDWIFSVTPAIEAGFQIGSADGTIFRPYARAGVTLLDTDEVAVSTSFAAAPGVPFTIKGRVEDVYGDVEAGVHVLTTQGINMRLNYEGRFGEDSRQHAGSLKLSAPW